MAAQLLAERIQVVRAAFNAMYSPSANNQVVKHNEAIIQQFKTSLQTEHTVLAAREFLLPILQDRPIQDYEALFGLQLINELILQVPPWLNHSEATRSSLRQLSVELVTHTNPTHYKNMVQEKVAYLLVGVAIREWPQQWPTFLNDLLAGALPPQMVCIVLRLMSEEVHEYSNAIASSRRQDLNQVMSEGLPQMLSFITSATDSFVNANNGHGLRTSLAVMEAFMAWAPIPSLFDARIPTACINMLNHAEFAPRALSALRVLFQRRGNTDAVHPDFRKEVFPSIVNYAVTNLKSIQTLSYVPPIGVVPEASESFRRFTFQHDPPGFLEVDTESHEYTLKFVTVLAKLGTISFLPAFSPKSSMDVLDEVAQQTASAFLDLMLSALGHPSMQVRNAAMPFFVNLISSIHRTLCRRVSKQPGVLHDPPPIPSRQRGVGNQWSFVVACFENPFMHQLLSTVVKRFVNTAALSLIRWPTDQLMQAYAEEDCAGDGGMLNESWCYFKSRAAQQISLATKLDPYGIMSIVLGRLIDLLAKASKISWPQPSATSSVPQAQNGSGASVAQGKSPYSSGFVVLGDDSHVWKFGDFNASHARVMEAALDGAVLATEAVLALLTSINYYENNPASKAAIEVLFQTILNLEQRNLQAAKILSLRMFIPLYRMSPDALKACLMCLVQIIENSKQSTLCFRAATSLSSICRRLRRSKPESLHQFVEPLRDFAIRVQVDRDYAPAERNLVLDAGVAVALATGELSQQASTLEALFKPLMNIITSSGMTDCIGNPQALLNFLASAPDREMALACLSSMDTAVAQVIRNNKLRAGSAAITTALTQAIAPQVVTFGSILVSSLHAMYNPSLFQLTDNKRRSILEPTSREVAYLLNLNDAGSSFMSPIAGSFNETEDNTEGDSVKSSLERADDVLKRFGIQVPDPQFSKEREHLKRMRVSAYELLRCSILSGVSQSPVHLQKLLEAICAHMNYLEPVHVQYLLSRVVKSLLSFQVTQAHSDFLTLVNSSQLPEFLHIVRRMVDEVSAGVEDPGSGLFALQVARDHGRKMVAKSAADLLSAMFPHHELKAVYVPVVFSHDRLGASLSSLWDSLLSPNLCVADSGSARSAISALRWAVDIAPVEAKSLYIGKLSTCLESAFRTDGMGSDSPHDAACSTITSYFKKWPEESKGVVMDMLSSLPADFQMSVAEKLTEITAALTGTGTNRKPVRTKLRSVIRVLAKKAGLSHRKDVVVGNLPGVARLAPKRNNRPKNEELQLADHTLDSLFGGGDPL